MANTAQSEELDQFLEDRLAKMKVDVESKLAERFNDESHKQCSAFVEAESARLQRSLELLRKSVEYMKSVHTDLQNRPLEVQNEANVRIYQLPSQVLELVFEHGVFGRQISHLSRADLPVPSFSAYWPVERSAKPSPALSPNLDDHNGDGVKGGDEEEEDQIVDVDFAFLNAVNKTSRHWRRIAKSCPILWSYGNIKSTKTSSSVGGIRPRRSRHRTSKDDQVEHLNFVLARSKDLPVSVRIEASGVELPYAPQLRAVLSANSHRFACLDLITGSWMSLTPFERGHLPSPITFSVQFAYEAPHSPGDAFTTANLLVSAPDEEDSNITATTTAEVPEAGAPQSISQIAPRRAFVRSDSFVDLSGLSGTSLRRLGLYGCGVRFADARRILSEAASLEYLEIRSIMNDQLVDDTPIPLPRLDTMLLKSRGALDLAKSIDAPALKHLKIETSTLPPVNFGAEDVNPTNSEDEYISHAMSELSSLKTLMIGEMADLNIESLPLSLEALSVGIPNNGALVVITKMKELVEEQQQRTTQNSASPESEESPTDADGEESGMTAIHSQNYPGLRLLELRLMTSSSRPVRFDMEESPSNLHYSLSARFIEVIGNLLTSAPSLVIRFVNNDAFAIAPLQGVLKRHPTRTFIGLAFPPLKHFNEWLRFPDATASFQPTVLSRRSSTYRYPSPFSQLITPGQSALHLEIPTYVPGPHTSGDTFNDW